MNKHPFFSKIAHACQYIVIGFLLMSLIFIFFDVVNARVFFYIAFYFTLLGLLSEVSMGTIAHGSVGKWIYLAFLLLGLSKLIWFGWQYFGAFHENRHSSYLDCGKRLVVSAIIAWYLLNHMHRIDQKITTVIRYALITAFLIASMVGFWQFTHHIARIDFYVGRATDAAYMYAGLSTVVISLLLAKQAGPKETIYCLLLFPIAYFVLLLTGTRNTMVTFPLALFLALVITTRHLSRRFIATFIIVIGLFLVATWQSFIKPGIERTVHEYHIFQQSQGNNLSSLSSRLAMWRVGINSFLANPSGLSEQARHQWGENYVKQTGKDKSALEFIDIHLHNEWIDSASLQGIQGVIALAIFYLLLLYQAKKWQDNKLLSLMLIIIFTGLTDVLFISREQTIFFSTLIMICAFYHLKQKQLNSNQN